MTINAMRVSAGEALTALQAGWNAQAAGQMQAAFMLHGRPGVGKTQVVTQLAARIGAELIDLRLTTIEPQDLRGLPYYDHETHRTVWYRPEDLPEGDAPTILFLDELTAAAPHVQPTVYGLLQERRVGRHRLPDSVFLVAAGNTVEDGAIAYEMGTGLSDRLIHMTVEAVPEQWLAGFAVPRGLHPAVTAFIKARPDMLDTADRALAEGHMIHATPRSWERASQILTAIPDRSSQRLMLAGVLGEAVAAEFALVVEDVAASLRLDEMLDARDAKSRAPLYPDSLHGLHALIFALVAAVDDARLGVVTDTLLDLRRLAKLRGEPVFTRLPLAELTTYGMELLIPKVLDLDLGAALLDLPSYADYAAEREKLGLT